MAGGAVALWLLLSAGASAAPGAPLVVEHDGMRAVLTRPATAPSRVVVETATLRLVGPDRGEARVPVRVCPDPACAVADVSVQKPAPTDAVAVPVRIPVLSHLPLTLCLGDVCATEEGTRPVGAVLDLQGPTARELTVVLDDGQGPWPPFGVHRPPSAGAVAPEGVATGYIATVLGMGPPPPLVQAAAVAQLRDGGVVVGPAAQRGVFVGDIAVTKHPDEVIGKDKPEQKAGVAVALPDGVSAQEGGAAVAPDDVRKVRAFAAGAGLYLERAPDAPVAAEQAALAFALADQPHGVDQDVLPAALDVLGQRGVRVGWSVGWLWPLAGFVVGGALCLRRGRARQSGLGLAAVALLVTGVLYQRRGVVVDRVLLVDAVQGAQAARVVRIELFAPGHEGTLRSERADPAALIGVGDGGAVRAGRVAPQELFVDEGGGAVLGLVTTHRARRRTAVEWGADGLVRNNAPGASVAFARRAAGVGRTVLDEARTVPWDRFGPGPVEDLAQQVAAAVAGACPAPHRGEVGCVVLLFDDEPRTWRIERVRPAPSVPGLVRESLVQFKPSTALPPPPGGLGKPGAPPPKGP